MGELNEETTSYSGFGGFFPPFSSLLQKVKFSPKTSFSHSLIRTITKALLHKMQFREAKQLGKKKI